jgi:hypothetical protein
MASAWHQPQYHQLAGKRISWKMAKMAYPCSREMAKMA